MACPIALMTGPEREVDDAMSALIKIRMSDTY